MNSRMDRRTFLRATLGAAGVIVVASCTDALAPSLMPSRRPSVPPGSLLPRPSVMPGATPSAVSSIAPSLLPSLTPAPRPTLRMAGGDVGFPNPFAYRSGPGFGLMTYVYDSLLLVDAVGTVQPWLASRFERSSDGLTYTFELRDGVTWQDGQPFTVEDVVFTFDYFDIHRPTLPPTLIFQPEGPIRAMATGERTVELRLDRPYVTFEETVAATFPIVPAHVWSAIPDPARAQDLEVLVGTGPYRLESYDRAQGSYLFVANDDFFLGRPFVKRIELPSVEDEATALLAGDIDAGIPGGIIGTPPDALRPFQEDPSFGILEQPLDFLVSLYWNVAKGGALADVEFRQACARAIDRTDLVERLAGGNGAPGNPGFLPPRHPFRADVEQYPFDMEAANGQLDDAGYPRSGPDGLRQGPDGRALRFDLLSAVPPPVLELIIGPLRALGVELRPQPADFATLVGQAQAGQYEMGAFIYGGISGDPDYMRTIYSSRVPKAFQSAQGYQNAEFDDLADRQLVTLDEDERMAMVDRMQQIVAADLPLLHLYYPTPFFVYRSAVFDQWADDPAAGPTGKDVLVTGLKDGGLEIRPIQD